MITRRTFFKWLGGLAASGLSLTTYAVAFEAGWRLRTVTHAFTPPRWTPGLKLKIVMLSDPHLAEPYMPVSRWNRIIERANALEPDLILLMGDYLMGSKRFQTKRLQFEDAANAAKVCKAKLGTYAICGNHDWWSDSEAQNGNRPLPAIAPMFEDIGIPVLENKSVQLHQDGYPFWLSGTSSIIAMWRRGGGFNGRDDLPGTLAQVTDDAPIIHLAHEPDLFVDVPDRVSVTLSGHTHGGQIRLFGYSPVTPSSYGNRFAYGHVVENGRHLVVSGGLGCSILPVRFGMPPEITVLELG